MLRFILATTISFLITFGAVSKNDQVSSLLNHVANDHIAHSHGEHDEHTHHHKHEKQEQNKSETQDHSHQLEFSLLSQFLHIEKIQSGETITSPLRGLVVLPFSSSSIILSNYSFSIFRPPIA